MTPDQRQNTVTWLSGEIRGIYPNLVGLPIGDIVSVVLDDMADDELDAILSLGEEQLAVWITEQVEEAFHRWYQVASEQVLCDHVGDVMADYAHITEEDIQLAVRYLKQRSAAVDLSERFEDPPEQWLKLIELVKRESENGS